MAQIIYKSLPMWEAVNIFYVEAQKNHSRRRHLQLMFLIAVEKQGYFVNKEAATASIRLDTYNKSAMLIINYGRTKELFKRRITIPISILHEVAALKDVSEMDLSGNCNQY